MAVTFGGKACCDPATLYTECLAAGLPTDWAGKASAFTVPAGREAGRGFVLLTGADLAALDAAADHELAFTGSDAGHAVTLSPVTLIRSECISPGAPDDGAAVFLCELADRRHFLKKVFFAGGYKSYNVTAPDGAGYQTASLNAGSPWAWGEVLADLSGLLGIGTVTPPFAPDGAPENLIYKGSVWDALNDVLARLACALCYDPTADTFSVVRLGAAADDPIAALEASADYLGVSWDGYADEPARAWRPEKVRVRFMRRPQPPAAAGGAEYHTVDVTLPAAAGVKAGTVVLLDDDRSAIGATGTPANAAALATRAAERAADWLRQREGAGRPLTRAWRDIQPLALAAVGQSVSKVVFDDRGEETRTWAVAYRSRDVEGWKPLADYPPWWPFVPGAASAWKAPVRARTTAAFPSCTYANGTGGAGATLTAAANGALPAQDGVTLVAGDALLVTEQSSQSQNGIYTVTAAGGTGAAWVLTRRTDADSGAELLGATVAVQEGTASADSVWLCIANSPITVGLTSLFWRRIAPFAGILGYEAVGSVTYPDTLSIGVDPTNGLTTGGSGSGLPNGFRIGISVADGPGGKPGVVSLGSQTFAGAKTFSAAVTMNGGYSTTNGTASGYLSATGGVVGGSGNGSCSITGGTNSGAAVAGDGKAAVGFFIYDLSSALGSATDFTTATIEARPGGGLIVHTQSQKPNGSAFYVISDLDYPYSAGKGYGIGYGNVLSGYTYIDGAGGTLGPGATALGGIITSVGSGSFGTVTSVSGGSSGGVTVTVTSGTTTPNIGVTLGNVTPGSVSTPTITQTAATSSSTPLTITGAAGQTAPLLQLKDSTGNEVLGITPGSAVFSTADGLFRFVGTVRADTAFRIGATDGATATTGGLTFQGGLYTGGALSGGSGTVTSVGLSMPTGFTVTGSPVTGSGTLAVTVTGDVSFANHKLTDVAYPDNDGDAATKLYVDTYVGAQTAACQPLDADLTALAALPATAGLLARTGAGAFAARTLTGPAAGITVTNGTGAGGDPALALANDLAALEALSGTNTIYYRSAADTWSAVTIGSGLSFSAGTLSAAGGSGTVTSVSGSGGATGLTLTGGPITASGTLTLGGTLAVASGGTGATSVIAAHDALIAAGAAIASAATTDLSTATGESVSVTGTATITALGTVAAGAVRVLRFAGALTLTHNATSLVLPGATNITTAAGDVAVVRSLGAGNWFCQSYTRAASAPPSGTNTGDQTTITGNAGTATALQTARTINGVSFNGTANITVTAAAGTLTGAALNATVTGSSLTSVGTLTDGATGAGFTVALSTSTVTGVLGLANGGTGTSLTASGPGVLVQTVMGGSVMVESALAVARGGTGVGTTPANGQLLIGNGTGYTLASLTAGSGITITPGAGSITIAATGTTPVQQNLLHNGGFEVWQRGTSLNPVADANYSADRWIALSQSGANDIVVTRQTGTTACRYAYQTNNGNVSAQRIGVIQFVESGDTIPRRGQTVRLQLQARMSSTLSPTLRYAIVEWTGTADAPTRDVVLNWASATFTPGNFFIATNLNVLATGSMTCTTSFTSATAITATVGASANNLAVIVWSDGTLPGATQVFVSEVGLYDGSSAQSWLPRPMQQELALCQRYLLAVAGHEQGQAQQAARTFGQGVLSFPVEMRATPSLLAGATFGVNAGSAGTVALNNAGTKSTGFFNSAANWTVGALVTVSATLSAEL